MYLGMCVGHYKSEGLNKLQKIEKLAKLLRIELDVVCR